MQNLIRKLAAVKRSPPFGSDPHFRFAPAADFPLLEAAPADVRALIQAVADGQQRTAITYELMDHGWALYFFEHAPPRHFTVRGLLLPAQTIKPNSARRCRFGGIAIGLMAGLAGLLLGLGARPASLIECHSPAASPEKSVLLSSMRLSRPDRLPAEKTTPVTPSEPCP
jgi:hypothetical protein